MGLILHCGSKLATLDQVAAVPTPSPKEGWFPIPHVSLVEAVLDQVMPNFRVLDVQHALNRVGAHYFGFLEVRGAEDYSTVIGIRNSHDKSWAASLVVGSLVTICDNLSFSGEVKVGRKHTRFIERDLPKLITIALGRLGEHRNLMSRRINAYKEYRFGAAQADRFLLNTVRTRVLPGQVVIQALDLWDHPDRQAYDGDEPSGWRMFNALTEVLKGRGGFPLPARTQGLHGLMDMEVFRRNLALDAIEGEGEMIDAELSEAPIPFAAFAHLMEV